MRTLRFCIAAIAAVALTASAADPSRVFIEFQPGKKAAAVAAVQAAGGLIHFEFDQLSAVAASIPEPALAGIQRNPNVAFIEADPQRSLFGQTTPYGIDMVQAPLVWSDSAGQGVMVGVIDSGVYAAHADFAGLSLGGYDGTSGNPNAWSIDGSAHGTHVVGTVAAQANTEGVVGVSPSASIYMVKVFGNDGTWAYASTLMDAVDRAKLAGAKVISMSLGGSLKSRTEDSFFKKKESEGLLCIAAAGNDGNTRNSYPASYNSVVSVAAVDSQKVVASFSQQNSQVELSAPGVGVLSTVPYLNNSTVTVGGSSYSVNPIEFAATGSTSGELVNGGLGDTTNPAWSGRVVLVERGSISFYEKVMNVQNSGGLAAIIYNNAAGNFSGTLGAGNSSTIPAVSMSQADGQALAAGALGQNATVDSQAPQTGSGYDTFDGTSMATPHVSGVAALLWSAFPGASNSDIRTAMQATAEDLGAAGKDNAYGYGLVQAKAAYDYLAGNSSGGGGNGGGNGDATPPVITGVGSSVVNAKRGTFEIHWTTDEPATSVVIISGSRFENTSLVTSHRMSFRGQKGATYTYDVESSDASGNTSREGSYTHNN